jgi:hypothetical protein
VQEVASKFFISDEVRRLVVMLGKLRNGSDVAFLGSLGVSSDLKTLDLSVRRQRRL